MKKYELQTWGYIIAFLSILLFMSCKARQAAEPTKITTNQTEKVVEKVHDTVFTTQTDSSAYRALLECQNGKVVVKEVQNATAGKYLKAPKFKVKDNVADCDCEAEAQQLFAKWKSTDTTKTQSTATVKPVFRELPFTWWQTTQIWFGRILMAILLIWLLKTIYNPLKLLKENG